LPQREIGILLNWNKNSYQGIEMKKEHDEIAAIHREESYSKIWFKKGLELLDTKDTDISKVIDIGAGKGEFLEILKNKFSITEAVAIDYSETNLEVLNLKGIKSIKVDLDNIDFNDFSAYKRHFDLVVSLETIEHVFDSNKLFAFFNFILKDGGLLLVSTPNLGSFRAKLFYLLRGYPFGESHHIRFFNRNKLNQYLFFSGFDIIKWNNYLTPDRDIIMRGFSTKNKYTLFFLDRTIYLLLLILQKLHISSSFTCNGLIAIARKNNLTPLGVESDYFKNNFDKLDSNEKNIWIEKIKKFLKKDKLKEHIYFKDLIMELISNKEAGSK